MLYRRDADGTGWLVAQCAERGNLAFDFVEPGADAAKEAFPGIGHGDAACRAREQPQAQPLFERADRVAQRRLRHLKLGGCLGEAALARDRDEGSQIVHVLPAHS